MSFRVKARNLLTNCTIQLKISPNVEMTRVCVEMTRVCGEMTRDCVEMTNESTGDFVTTISLSPPHSGISNPD